jgi:hypothetical protein
MFQSIGKLIYSEPYKLIVEVDNDIGNYYRSLVPSRIQKPMFPSHISVVRENNLLSEFWQKYHNQEIDFYYNHYIYNDDIYYWLEASCDLLECIRTELGLEPTSYYTKSPDGQHKFHITIGNTKFYKKTKHLKKD